MSDYLDDVGKLLFVLGMIRVYDRHLVPRPPLWSDAALAVIVGLGLRLAAAFLPVVK